MIQRVQTLYLLIALILSGSLFFLDLAQLVAPGQSFELAYNGVIKVDEVRGGEVALPAVALSVLLIITVTSVVASILIFRNRVLQMRVCGLALGFLLGLSVLSYFFGKSAANQLGAIVSFNIPVVFPLVAVILVVLAIRAIGKDEALVRSINRLR